MVGGGEGIVDGGVGPVFEAGGLEGDISGSQFRRATRLGGSAEGGGESEAGWAERWLAASRVASMSHLPSGPFPEYDVAVCAFVDARVQFYLAVFSAASLRSRFVSVFRLFLLVWVSLSVWLVPALGLA